MDQESKRRSRIIEEIESLVEEARSAGETLGENLREAIQSVLAGRDNVVMVRINKESLAKLDELVDAGIVTSRSEAAAFLIGEGIKARKPLFDRIAEKTAEIRRVKEELRTLLEEQPPQG